ncbi:MAG: 1-acyl-sn-glycerol-3-phosphate acyltransferase [Treponema sp.]|nr:1-acyl-sn-glycerol-3-phosphate acyltransferase [Treponema sp.]
MYIPPITFTYQYPDIQDQHMMKVVEKYSPKLDETYIYRERSFKWRFKHFWLNVLLNTVVLPVVVIRYAVKVKGRENLKKNKKLLKEGFVTVSNHVIEWDFLAILHAFFPKKAYFPIWSRNMETPMAPLFKTIGGIPIPTSLHAGKKFKAAMDSVLDEGKWLHVFAEGSMWYFYPAIRKFHKGAAVFAVKHMVPLIPIAISYRQPKGLYKLFKKYPNLTVNIGSPLLPNKTLDRKEAEIDLNKRARLSVMNMMGIKDEEENQKLMDMYKK